MRVTHVAPTTFGDDGLLGGGERYPLELARSLACHVRCRLVVFGRQARRLREPSGLDVVVLRARGYAKGHPGHPIGAGLVRATRDADIVHAHQLYSRTTAIALRAARLRGQRRVVTDHGLPASGGYRPHRSVERFLVVSRFSAHVLRAPPDRTMAIYGGADPVRFHPDRDDRREGILFVGRITPHKGIDRLIQALPRGSRLTIAGSTGHDSDRPERDYPALLRALAASAPAHVDFAGAVSEDELPRLMRRHALLAMPSVEETCYGRHVETSELLGLSAIEAMASGTPVVASNVGGLPEVVAHEQTGYLVPPGDVGALRDRLAILLHDRGRRDAMGRAAREVACERFTWGACATRCLARYEDLVDEGSQFKVPV
jgi:glycosyltransferase involved in cell wall biosynthesis